MRERGGSTLALAAWEERGDLLQQLLNTEWLTGMPSAAAPQHSGITHSACPQGMGATPELARR